jgi:P27 family predicted phage terminase small subunit
MTAVRAPKHLSKTAAAWWRQVVASWELEPHHERLLTEAATSWDRAQEARSAIEEHGLTYTDRFGQPRVRPEVAVERDARSGFVRCMRELDLDAEAGPDPRPARLGRSR